MYYVYLFHEIFFNNPCSFDWQRSNEWFSKINYRMWSYHCTDSQWLTIFSSSSFHVCVIWTTTITDNIDFVNRKLSPSLPMSHRNSKHKSREHSLPLFIHCTMGFRFHVYSWQKSLAEIVHLSICSGLEEFSLRNVLFYLWGSISFSKFVETEWNRL